MPAAAPDPAADVAPDDVAGVAAPDDDDASRPDPLADLKLAADNARQAVAFLAQAASARVSQVGYSVKKLVLLALLLALLGVIATTAIVTATALLVVGVARMLAAPLPDGFEWLGPVIVGLAGAVGVPLVAWWTIRRIAAAGRRGARERYVERLRRQREAFGTDAALRSADAAEPSPPPAP